MTLESKLEAILFHKSEPMPIKKLAELLGQSEAAINEALISLEANLAERGVKLISNDKSVMLATAPGASEIIEKLTKEELSRDLGKAGLETLTIILYYGPISRPQIDYIRGVNSSFILRALLVRGLIDRITNPADSRSFLYKPTFDLLAYLSIGKVEELPEYDNVRQEIESFLSAKQTEENESQSA